MYELSSIPNKDTVDALKFPMPNLDLNPPICLF